MESLILLHIRAILALLVSKVIYFYKRANLTEKPRTCTPIYTPPNCQHVFLVLYNVNGHDQVGPLGLNQCGGALTELCRENIMVCHAFNSATSVSYLSYSELLQFEELGGVRHSQSGNSWRHSHELHKTYCPYSYLRTTSMLHTL